MKLVKFQRLFFSFVIIPATSALIITSVLAGKKKYKSYSFDTPLIPPLVKVEKNPFHMTFRTSRTMRMPEFKIEGELPLKAPHIIRELPKYGHGYGKPGGMQGAYSNPQESFIDANGRRIPGELLYKEPEVIELNPQIHIGGGKINRKMSHSSPFHDFYTPSLSNRFPNIFSFRQNLRHFPLGAKHLHPQASVPHITGLMPQQFPPRHVAPLLPPNPPVSQSYFHQGPPQSNNPPPQNPQYQRPFPPTFKLEHAERAPNHQQQQNWQQNVQPYQHQSNYQPQQSHFQQNNHEIPPNSQELQEQYVPEQISKENEVKTIYRKVPVSEQTQKWIPIEPKAKWTPVIKQQQYNTVPRHFENYQNYQPEYYQPNQGGYDNRETYQESNSDNNFATTENENDYLASDSKSYGDINTSEQSYNQPSYSQQSYQPSDEPKEPQDGLITFSISGPHGGEPAPIGYHKDAKQYQEQLKHYPDRLPPSLSVAELQRYYKHHTFTDNLQDDYGYRVKTSNPLAKFASLTRKLSGLISHRSLEEKSDKEISENSEKIEENQKEEWTDFTF